MICFDLPVDIPKTSEADFAVLSSCILALKTAVGSGPANSSKGTIAESSWEPSISSSLYFADPSDVRKTYPVIGPGARPTVEPMMRKRSENYPKAIRNG